MNAARINFLKIDKNLSSRLSHNNYYGNSKIKELTSDYQIDLNDDNTEKDKIYTIQDPDGYTNLRKDKNAQSQILQKIKSGEQIEVLDKSGDWVLIKTKEGNEGYVHKSRIK